MSTSVASARHMEQWRRERAEAKQTVVPASEKQKANFNAMKPDIEQLEAWESKVHKFVDRQEQKDQMLETEAVINVMGSTAGAGSGDFHMYRGYRNKELARLKELEDEKKEEEKRQEWDIELAERTAAHDSKAKKRAAKRQKQKDAKRAKKGGADAPDS